MAKALSILDGLIATLEAAGCKEVPLSAAKKATGAYEPSERLKSRPELLMEFNKIMSRDPFQLEFLEAVDEVLSSLIPLFDERPQYLKALNAVCECERIVQFRVPWVDDCGKLQVNRAMRVQYSQTLGPYKGGLRFHPSVNQSIIKFLGFEQVFKNALTGLPMGGGKGGSDFDPKGKSDNEVQRFCVSFMSELHKHIGPNTDVPAGDIGVGAREVGFLFGEWKRQRIDHSGVLTGKSLSYGSNIRPEATGYGLLAIMVCALQSIGDSIRRKRVAISGSGNVALFAAERCYQLGATVVSFSDSGGTVVEEKGFSKKQFEQLREIKAKRGRVKEYMDVSATAKFYEKDRPWRHVRCDIALPCATQNEVNAAEATALADSGCLFVGEGANMPSDPGAIEVFKKRMRIWIPGKAANAGGVAVSGLEMAQNSMRTRWSRKVVHRNLEEIMANIWRLISRTAHELGRPNDLQLGANAAGFIAVIEAMKQQGLVMF